MPTEARYIRASAGLHRKIFDWGGIDTGKGRAKDIQRLDGQPIRRGDIYYADLSVGVGSEQAGCRPVLVIQNDTGNRHSRTVIITVVTSRTEHGGAKHLPTHCPLAAAVCGLEHDSSVMLEQLRTIDKARLRNYVGTLEEDDMAVVDKALAISVGLKD